MCRILDDLDTNLPYGGPCLPTRLCCLWRPGLQNTSVALGDTTAASGSCYVCIDQGQPSAVAHPSCVAKNLGPSQTNTQHVPYILTTSVRHAMDQFDQTYLMAADSGPDNRRKQTRLGGSGRRRAYRPEAQRRPQFCTRHVNYLPQDLPTCTPTLMPCFSLSCARFRVLKSARSLQKGCARPCIEEAAGGLLDRRKNAQRARRLRRRAIETTSRGWTGQALWLCRRRRSRAHSVAGQVQTEQRPSGQPRKRPRR